MSPQQTPASTSITCDMTDASDTPHQRLAAYEQLFTSALLGRERTSRGIRFRFRADPGIEVSVRDLAAREKACCAFFTFDVGRVGDEVWWDASVIDDDMARGLLEEFYQLPVTVADDAQTLHDRFSARGLQVVVADDTGAARPVTREELALDD